MHYSEHHQITNFAKHQELNRMYAFITIGHVGIALIGIFIPIYFYNLGYSIQQILLFEFLYAIYYIALIPLAVKIIQKLCVNKSFIYSFPFRVLFFLLLIVLKDLPWLFYILPLILALRFTVYNLGFHFNMIAYSERKETGKNMALIYILLSVSSFIAPFIGALVISYLGFDYIIYVTIAFLILSILPLFGVQEVCPLPDDVDHKRIWKNIFNKNQYDINVSHFGYAIESLIGKVLWPLFLFIFLASYEKVGIITSLSLFIAAIAMFIIGKLTDSTDRRGMIKKGTRVFSISWLFRIIAINPALLVFSDIFKNVAEKYMIIPWTAYSYDVAKTSRPFEYIVSREISINIFRIIAIPILIIVFDFLPLTYAFVGVFLIAALFTLLVSKITKFKV